MLAAASSARCMQVEQASSDLGRLQALMDDACLQLQARFDGLAQGMQSLQHAHPHWPGLTPLWHEVDAAVVALQFQDLAQQLIAHTRKQLGLLASCGCAVAGQVAAGAQAVNPVNQSAMSAGSVDLF
jgi:hypothetical protein